MSDFAPVFAHILKVEGGMRLINVEGDRGGRTYAGISEGAHPDWPGWIAIEAGRAPTQDEVREFYRERYWNRITGDDIESAEVAEVLMSSAVLSGVGRAVKMAQMVVDAAVDGSMGPKTMAAINATDPELFEARFALMRINRYRKIANADRSQRRFLRGWMNRVFEELAS